MQSNKKKRISLDEIKESLEKDICQDKLDEIIEQMKTLNNTLYKIIDILIINKKNDEPSYIS